MCCYFVMLWYVTALMLLLVTVISIVVNVYVYIIIQSFNVAALLLKRYYNNLSLITFAISKIPDV
jgi:hypothetical protein